MGNKWDEQPAIELSETTSGSTEEILTVILIKWSVKVRTDFIYPFVRDFPKPISSMINDKSDSYSDISQFRYPSDSLSYELYCVSSLYGATSKQYVIDMFLFPSASSVYD